VEVDRESLQSYLPQLMRHLLALKKEFGLQERCGVHCTPA
jgi:hypothetical protein